MPSNKKRKILETEDVSSEDANTPPEVHAVLEQFKAYLVEHCVRNHQISLDLSLLEMSIEAIGKHTHPIPCPRTVPAQDKARIQGEHIPFSSSSANHLRLLGIDDNATFELPRLDSEVVVTNTKKSWSSMRLISHIDLLENVVLSTNERYTRACIDSFFFRAYSMLPDNKGMLLAMEYPVSQTVQHDALVTLSGRLDYVALLGDENLRQGKSPLEAFSGRHSLSDVMPTLAQNGELHGFLIVEAKSLDTPLGHHIPQVKCEMYACGQHLRKKVIRGVLTNGFEWMFLILTINDDFKGGSFKQSNIVAICPHPRRHFSPIDQQKVDFIADTLLHWICNSFTDSTGPERVALADGGMSFDNHVLHV